MGVPVTVDSDDLETLLYSAGAMTLVERALHNAKDDLLYQMAKPKIADAVARANHARLNAIANDAPDPDEPEANQKDYDNLLDFIGFPLYRGPVKITLQQWDSPEVNRWRRLRLVEMGTPISGYRWADGCVVGLDFDHVGVRLTKRGQKFMEGND